MSRSSRLLGWIAVGIGIVFSGAGLGYLVRGDRLEAVDGLLLGGLALAAGCVILRRRGG